MGFRRADDQHAPTPPPVPLTVTGARNGSAATVLVSGELDVATFRLLRDPVRELLEAGARQITIDVEHTTFVDSSGLGTLIELHRLTERVGGNLTLRSPTPQLQHLLSVTGLDGVIDIEEDHAGADGTPIVLG